MIGWCQEIPAPLRLTGLPEHQKWIAIATAVLMVVAVVELVRRRRLREELSGLWIATAVCLVLLALEPRVLGLFQSAIGAQTPTSALFFGALVFLMLVSLLVSVRLSRLTLRNKALMQQVALQQRDLEDLVQEVERLRRELAQGQEPGVAVERAERQGG